MTNITLSIQEQVYKDMKKYSEIKWSEFIRKAIKKRIEELKRIENDKNHENILTMLASEHVLKKDWDTPEEDEAWKDL